MHALDHPNVLKFHAWYETSNHLWLILEYCCGGDLAALLAADGRLPEPAAADVGAGLAAGLAALHAAGGLHRDVRPGNVLLDEAGVARLAGFGLSVRPARGGGGGGPRGVPPGPAAGSPAYMAPELFLPGGAPSTASDLYSLGCVLYELLAGAPPFGGGGGSLVALVRSALASPPPPLPASVSRAGVNLIMGLLAKAPGDRPSWPEVAAAPFWRAPLRGAPTEAELPPAPPAPADAGAWAAALAAASSKAMTEADAAAAPRPSDDDSPPRGAEPDGADVRLARHDAEVLFGEVSSDRRAALMAGGGALSRAGSGAARAAARARAAEAVAASAPQPAPPSTSTLPQHHSTPPPPLHSLVWHPTADAGAAPVVGRAGDADPPPASALPYDAEGDVAEELITLYRHLSARPAGREAEVDALLARVGALASAGAPTANAVVNSSLSLLLIRRLGRGASGWSSERGSGECAGAPASPSRPDLAARAASSLGLLLRHATHVDDEVARAGLLPVLAAAAGSGGGPCARRAAAALAEGLFYASAQPPASPWGTEGVVDDSLPSLISSPDPGVAGAVAAGLANVWGGRGGAARAPPAGLAAALAALACTAGAAADAAATALARMLRRAPAVASEAAAAVDAPSLWARTRGPSLALLAALLASPEEESVLPDAGDYADIAAALAAAADDARSPAPARGRALVVAALLLAADPSFLAAAAGARLLRAADRLARDGDPYCASAAAALRREATRAAGAALAHVATALEARSPVDTHSLAAAIAAVAGGAGLAAGDAADEAAAGLAAALAASAATPPTAEAESRTRAALLSACEALLLGRCADAGPAPGALGGLVAPLGELARAEVVGGGEGDDAPPPAASASRRESERVTSLRLLAALAARLGSGRPGDGALAAALVAAAPSAAAAALAAPPPSPLFACRLAAALLGAADGALAALEREGVPDAVWPRRPPAAAAPLRSTSLRRP